MSKNTLQEEKYSRKQAVVVIESAESVSEVGRCNKKSRRLTGTGIAFSNPEKSALTLGGENAPPQPNFPDPTKCFPQLKLSAKNFQSSTLDAWSPNPSSSNTRELTHVEETCLIDFPSKELVEDSSMDFVIGFIDEEEMFNMPGLVNSMAEGMLLTPPAMKRGFKWSHDIDQVQDANYVNLWGQ